MSPWLLLTRSYADQKLSHALMLTGGTHESRRDFARRLAALLLCEDVKNSNDDGLAACGLCRGCLQYAADVHPNLMVLSPEDGKRDIGIEAVRGAMERLSLSSHYGGRKLLIVDPVDRLNPHGRDALLKTLEEPPAGSHLILLVDRLMSLPATVRSRCQMVRLPSAAVPRAEAPEIIAILDSVCQGRIQEPLAQLQASKLSREAWHQLGTGLTQRLHHALQASLLGHDRSAFSWAHHQQLSDWYRQAIQFLRALSGNASPQLLIESLMIKIWKSRAGRSHA